MSWQSWKPRKFHRSPGRLLTLGDFPQRSDTWMKSASRYLRNRGLFRSYMDSLRTVYPTQRGICFILFGTFGYQERITELQWQEGLRKYLYPAGVDTSKALFIPEIEDIKEPRNHPVIVTEGTTDALAAHFAGYPAISTLGSMITWGKVKNIVDVVPRGVPIVYLPDNDAAGAVAAGLMMGRAWGRIRVVWLPKRYKDLAEMPREERIKWLASVKTGQ